MAWKGKGKGNRKGSRVLEFPLFFNPTSTKVGLKRRGDSTYPHFQKPYFVADPAVQVTPKRRLTSTADMRRRTLSYCAKNASDRSRGWK